MQILVSGGTGFVGKAVVKSLHAAGHAVVVLTRDPASHRRRNAASGMRLSDAF